MKEQKFLSTVSVFKGCCCCWFLQHKVRNRASLLTSRTFQKHQEMSVSLLKLQNQEQSWMNSAMCPEIRSRVIHREHRHGEMLLLQGRAKRHSLADTVTGGGDIVTHGGQWWLHCFQFLSSLCLSGCFCPKKTLTVLPYPKLVPKLFLLNTSN